MGGLPIVKQIAFEFGGWYGKQKEKEKCSHKITKEWLISQR